MRIRKFALADLGRVLRIERAAFGPDSYSITTFLAHLVRDRKGILVAVADDGSVVGYVLVRVGVRWLGVRRGGITSIAVDCAHRRRGFGRALLASALDHLELNGVEEADLEVSTHNRAAQSLYEAFGFVRSRILPQYYGPDLDGLRMVLNLRAVRAADRPAEVTGAHPGRHG